MNIVKNEKNKKRSRLIIAVIAIVELAVIAGLITWAWIEGSVSPGLKGNNLQIASSPGLIMSIDNRQTDVININDYILDRPDAPFVLAEASSNDGRNIVIRKTFDDDSQQTNINDVYVYPAVSADENVKFIDIRFKLRSDYDIGYQNVWLDSSRCFIKERETENELEAIRISVTVTRESGSPPTAIFAENVTTDSSMRTINAVGDPGTYDEVTGKIISSRSQVVYSFESRDNSYPGSTPLISNLASGEEANIEVRIWLEGGDPSCIDYDDTANSGYNSIAGKNLDLSIFFKSEAAANQNP